MNIINEKSSSKFIFKMFFVILPAILLTFLFSCEEDPSSLGSGLIPKDDQIGIFYDTTISINGYLTDDENYVTRLNGHPNIGVLNDPYFGSLKSSFATTYIPTSLFITFGSAIADSSVLYLVIDSTYGKFDFSKGYKAYRLNKKLEYDSVYYSNTNLEDFIDLSDPISLSSRISGDTLLILSLNKEFSEFLIPPVDSIYYYRTVSQFLEKYYGIAVVPNDNNLDNGILLNIDLYNTNSKITLFYNDTSTYNYKFYSLDNYHLNFSVPEKDHSSGIIQNFIDNDSLESDSLLFLQGLGGMSSKIVLSNYQSWLANYKYTILRAELTIPVLKDFDLLYFYPPEKLYFISSDADSNLYQIEDYVVDKFFDGSFNDDNYTYSFDISKHLSNLLNGVNTDSVLYFRMINSSIYPHRAILKLNESKLKITYTKY